ncbi:aminotransferase class I/II-fold pyridoxal phosphate-dependent enzyme [Planosporangium flavigriseum]|uniref:GntR family transcriptional regulator n=1 Tax=Planosporangium flavigriseum TaxID=373681 RepID=A0A8J3LKW4_9ACTN|nr:aminotransferase class I/II-fold pyridoxal phosphate-dependent enzyme [Planosporangium flavigriseum]NJC66036.1 aminotransferase class I/II-fold pyridoxal phosphate-dependent enzyme [Planosporangium flavigriseum]GIG75068.1 GntR family transcriptional regulator [Planosporangium flavigriseum]
MLDPLLVSLEERLEEPSARGIANAVTRAMRDGVLTPGTKLPPIRTVAAQLQLSPTTVSAGWALLARSGAIHTDGRRGTTIADLSATGPARYRRALQRQMAFGLDLSTGVPDSALLPDLANALQQLQTAGVPGSYLDDPVLPELVHRLRAEWPYRTDVVTVVDGAMDALDLAARSLLRFGDQVVVEHPCFAPLIDLLEAIGVQVVGVPVDDEGMSAVALAEAVAAAPVAAVFLQPRAQNPTGASLTRTRAEALAAILAKADTWVIEDDSAGAVAATPDISLGQWIPDQTLHVRSYSKSHGPDLRLAAMGGPANLMEILVGRRQLGQGWSSRLLQRVLLSLLDDAEAVRTVAYARDEYARRRAALVDALATHGIEVGGNDGINVWVPVLDESAALLRLASQGIGVAPGSPFAVLPGPVNHIRVTAGLLTEGHAEVAAEIAAATQAGAWAGVR